MRAFLHGAAAPLAALRVLRAQPGLRRYVVVPIAINVAVGVVLYAVLLVAGLRAVDRLVGDAAGLAALLGALLQVVLVVALFVLVGFVVVRFGVVLGSPWYGKLSEELEQQRTGSAPPAEPLTVAGVARDLRRALAFEARKLALVVGIGLPLLVANVVPVLGSAVAAAGGLALAATIACLDFFDGPLERRRWSFRQKLSFVRAGLPMSAGFGLVCVALLAVPVLNLLSIPLCVAAGTLLAVERVR